jgi:LmbE family N-acetylglucosaminyl deacetylase
MKFHQPNADLYIPDNQPLPGAIRRTTHLGIGAHQDDLEFMALHGILECHQRADRWFGGVTCTDGRGSARSGPYATLTDDEMQAVRLEEQRSAARIGDYAFMAQLGYPSAAIKRGAGRLPLVDDLVALLQAARPQYVYTHNPFDKHATHLAVFHAVIAALRRLPAGDRPHWVVGCEGWRGLDWLPDDLKVVLDVSAQPALSAALNGVFVSQTVGGKRYDLAVEGRRTSNATFLDSHAVDVAERTTFAIDLTALIRDDAPSVNTWAAAILDRFNSQVLAALQATDASE